MTSQTTKMRLANTNLILKSGVLLLAILSFSNLAILTQSCQAQEDSEDISPPRKLHHQDNSEESSGNRKSRENFHKRFHREEGEGGKNRTGHAERMGKFIESIQSLHTALKDPHNAVGLAILGIKESAKKQGKPLNAVPKLKEILDSTKDQQTRNITLFTLKQIYKETKDENKATEINDQILKENLALIAKSS